MENSVVCKEEQLRRMETAEMIFLGVAEGYRMMDYKRDKDIRE
jgi:hypothetical protein